MKNVIFLFLLCLLFLGSCSKSNNQTNATSYNATIVGKGLDCGDAYLIRFDTTVQGLPNNDMNFLYYEINLPDQYKIAGKKILVEFRAPSPSEMLNCTTVGPGYPQIFITKVDGFEK